MGPRAKVSLYHLCDEAYSLLTPIQDGINEVLGTSIALLEKGRVEETFMLKWMVNFGVNPNELSMLIYDTLTINGTIHYYDDCTGQYNTIYLDPEVFSELLSLKNPQARWIHTNWCEY